MSTHHFAALSMTLLPIIKYRATCLCPTPQPPSMPNQLCQSMWTHTPLVKG
ncbi:hypothetical protein PF005_g8643 [Phytophthora fragariae]|uniref:RxLR effector protein n=1 Tax=Phytophthora fragariae TaxID=53985 RepID=A0A6A3ZT59_9STRA|nr:hypothetical protein PF009_g9633 [Phytophthora fragariae]KAE9015564.1 hypothetical protein PF011_g7557 [Phytophthora fragariae]KAE9118402.1 hypothetical protein PF007_g8941 [Phytophthora fragariae]KAE9120066.1 hypothetical protein PF010_g7633 [Phytophthora fragariae]KAE9147389.1 hypothetical protein PF006_g7928 [Phytophthora fragariae]